MSSIQWNSPVFGRRFLKSPHRDLWGFSRLERQRIQPKVKVTLNLCTLQILLAYDHMTSPFLITVNPGYKYKSWVPTVWAVFHSTVRTIRCDLFFKKVNGWPGAFQIPSHTSHLSIFTLSNQELPLRKRQNKGTYDCLGESNKVIWFLDLQRAERTEPLVCFFTRMDLFMEFWFSVFPSQIPHKNHFQFKFLWKALDLKGKSRNGSLKE